MSSEGEDLVVAVGCVGLALVWAYQALQCLGLEREPEPLALAVEPRLVVVLLLERAVWPPRSAWGWWRWPRCAAAEPAGVIPSRLARLCTMPIQLPATCTTALWASSRNSWACW